MALVPTYSAYFKHQDSVPSARATSLERGFAMEELTPVKLQDPVHVVTIFLLPFPSLFQSIFFLTQHSQCLQLSPKPRLRLRPSQLRISSVCFLKSILPSPPPLVKQPAPSSMAMMKSRSVSWTKSALCWTKTTFPLVALLRKFVC